MELEGWQSANPEQQLFSGTISDSSPGPTIAYSSIRLVVDGQILGYEVLESYDHKVTAVDMGEICQGKKGKIFKLTLKN